jgi:hypothetical protein
LCRAATNPSESGGGNSRNFRSAANGGYWKALGVPKG